MEGSEELFKVKKHLAEAEARISSYEEQVTQLQQDNNRLEAALETKSKENESLQQTNYSQGLKLSSTQQTLDCCTAELETLQQELDTQTETITKQLQQQHATNIEVYKSKAAVLSQRLEGIETENSRLRDQLSLGQSQVREAQEALTSAAALSVSVDDSSDLHAQVASLTCEKHDLATQLAQVVSERDAAVQQLSSTQHTLQQLDQQLEDKECRMTSYYNEVQRLKEELMEHEQELELYRMNEKDPQVKGNSLFAEVEDHRLYLEQQMIKLKGYYETVQQHYRLKVQQVSRLKLQVASLLTTSGSREDSDYVVHLNESLRIARQQISMLQDQIKDMARTIKMQSERPLVIQCLPEGCKTKSGYLRSTYEAVQQELAVVKVTLKDARFHGVVLSDQILTLQRKLHLSEGQKSALKAENMRLTVKLQDVQAEKGIFSERTVTRPVVERLPGWEEAQARIKAEKEEKERLLKEKEDAEQAEKEDTEKTKGEEEGATALSDLSNLTAENTAKNTGDKKKKRKWDIEEQEATDETEEDRSKAAGLKDDVLEAAAGTSSSRGCLADKENSPAEGGTAGEVKKKKSVRLQEVVDTQDVNGEREALPLKEHDGSGGPRLRRPMRRMVAVPPQPLPDNVAGCKQQ